MPGPIGANIINWDTYATATPPAAKPPVQVWVNPADPTRGPAQPACLGGGSNTDQALPDTYFMTQNSGGTVPNDASGTVAVQIEVI